MDLDGRVTIDASRDIVYAALINPEVLRKCIPGCEELVKHSETTYEAKVALKIGPVKARFGGQVQLDVSGAPKTVSLEGEGSGGAAGFAKGGADVVLEESNGHTTLTYSAKASVGGKIAQLGNRLVQSTAKKLADQFFKEFSQVFDEKQANA